MAFSAPACHQPTSSALRSAARCSYSVDGDYEYVMTINKEAAPMLSDQEREVIDSGLKPLRQAG